MTATQQTNSSGRVVVNTSNLSELKTTCDNSLKEFLKSKGYDEMHTHTDVKLILGYVGVIFCAIDFAYSWKYPFSQTKWFSYISVSIYAITSGLALLYSYLVQRDTFFVGYNKAKGHIVSAGSSTKRNEPVYRLTLTTRPIRGRQDPPVFNSKPLEVRRPFATWFYEDGEFAGDKFQQEAAVAVENLLNKKAE
ncbi:hypothetical protein DL89DRAFT_291391 [Linderina pennispora]|uniref:Signal peptidase complex subunit 2 n=1 Tax=Linderina pennispora TaxID=61395 RepID=A0A1Y1WF51_9FUNG|nr:uncharacterized protein DL89DRAFT_291391 [Linderina pennispora]ORX72170.1 hypothetical protein DL89DRAFT_291391 [Linderina pennispora]